jgi:cobalt/nickel transport system ATP-binding protein
MSDRLLALEGISFDYGRDAAVLRDLDFALAPGERVVLTGSNGSGKTTLLHLIMGLVRPRAGRVEVLGQSRSTETEFRDVRSKVGLLFQDSDDQLFCPTVLEDVAFGPLNLGMSSDEAQAIVSDTLHLLGLDGYQDRITYRLSYGEKKMVALATILAMQPRILLLDEPTAGLDERHEARLTAVLQDLPQEMIVVTHNRTFLERIATRVLHLSDGRIVEEEAVDSE